MGDNVLDVTLETVVLGIDLAGTEIDKLPSLLTAVVQDLNFQKEIEYCLQGYGKALLAKYNKANTLTLSDAEKLAIKSVEDTGKKIGKEALKDLSERIQSTPEFAALKEKFDDLVKKIKDRPVGVWFTDTKVFIVASAVVLNGAAIVFFTSLAAKKVGTPAILTALEGQTLKFKPFGSIEIGVGVPKYNRTTDVADIKISGTKKWQSIKVELDVVVHTNIKHVAVEGASGEVKVVIPVQKDLRLDLTGGVSGDRSLAKENSLDHRSVLVNLGVDITGSTKNGDFKLGLSGFAGAGGGKPEFGLTFGLSIDFK